MTRAEASARRQCIIASQTSAVTSQPAQFLHYLCRGPVHHLHAVLQPIACDGLTGVHTLYVRCAAACRGARGGKKEGSRSSAGRETPGVCHIVEFIMSEQHALDTWSVLTHAACQVRVRKPRLSLWRSSVMHLQPTIHLPSTCMHMAVRTTRLLLVHLLACMEHSACTSPIVPIHQIITQ